MNERHDLGYGMDRRKRGWVPEWLWYWACNPVPFWNDTVAITYPQFRLFIRPLTNLLSEPTEEVTGVNEEVVERVAEAVWREARISDWLTGKRDLSNDPLGDWGRRHNWTWANCAPEVREHNRNIARAALAALEEGAPGGVDTVRVMR